MGPLFVWLVWMILLIPVGLILGTIAALSVFPIYFRFRKTPPEKQKVRWWHRLIVVLATIITIQGLATAAFAFFMIREAVHSDDFYKSQGLTDSWRIPLCYPYEIIMIDNLDDGGLCKTSRKGKPGDPNSATFPEVSPQLSWVRAYCKQGTYVVGYMYEDPWYRRNSPEVSDTTWFSFDCSSGKSMIYLSHDEYLLDMPRCGFAKEPELLSLDLQLGNYWSTH